MLALVNDVLDIAAIEAGKRSVVKEPINIEEMLKSCIKNIERSANSRKIILETRIPENLPTLYADKRSVTQIMLNLLSNAVKFTDPHGSITISAEAINEHIALIVSDTGIGIPADRLSMVTEPFRQSNPDPHTTQAGTGLGLSIVASLVELHDGTLELQSEIGKGTTVRVALPLQGIEEG